MASASSLDELVGEEISAICFVMDYVEIHFNGPLLRCIANPRLDHNGESWLFPAPGSRDALCVLIGDIVTAVEIAEGEAIRLVTLNRGLLSVPLDEGSARAGEWAHFVSGANRPIQVW